MQLIHFHKLLSPLNKVGGIKAHRKLNAISENCIARIEKYTGAKLKLYIGYSGSFGNIVHNSFYSSVAIALQQEHEMIHYHKDSNVANVWYQEQLNDVNSVINSGEYNE